MLPLLHFIGIKFKSIGKPIGGDVGDKEAKVYRS
jgi:hypothetical protein